MEKDTEVAEDVYVRVIEQKNQEINDLRNSLSWRITAPLRYIYTVIVLCMTFRTIKTISSIIKSIAVGARKLLLLVARIIFYGLPISESKKISINRYALYSLSGLSRGFANTSTLRDFYSNNDSRNNAFLRALERRRLFTPGNLNLLRTSNDLPVVTISFVLHNSSKWLAGLFKSILELSYPKSRIQLIFVDNGSLDDSMDLVEKFVRDNQPEYGYSIVLIRQENVGFGRGHNRSFRECRGKYFLVSNVDVEFEADSLLLAIISAHTDDEKAVAWEFRQKPYEHPKYYDPLTFSTHWVSGACVLFLSNAFRSVEGFDRKYFMYGEDVDISYRLRDSGYELKYCPHSVVWHFSYSYPREVKHDQMFFGSAANIFNRLRFGSFRQIVFVPYLVFRFVSYQVAGYGLRKGLKKGLKFIRLVLDHSYYFLSSRKKSRMYFDFNEWDYSIRRDGAFFPLKKNVSGVGANSALVSVVMRTHGNRKEWLLESITSVLNQTYRDIQLIVIEDGGDGSKELLSSIKPCQGFRIEYESIEKLGRTGAGNRGLELCDGDFIAFLDDDDAYFADHLEVLSNELVLDEDIVATYSPSWEVQIDIKSVEPLRYDEILHETPKALRQTFSRHMLRERNFIAIQAILFRKHLYTEFGGFETDIDYLEDWILWNKYSAGGDFLFVDKTTSLHRTPYKTAERASRQVKLDQGYTKAIQKISENIVKHRGARIVPKSLNNN